MDNTSVHPSCVNQAHQIDLHLWRGAPKNLDPERPVQILVNQGFVVGYSPERMQPVWSAYRVAGAKDDVKYDRPIHYHDDLRLDPEHRIGRHTFGRLGTVQLNVGHMTPNEVINRQFGRLAQMETFLMSNMSPQYGSLNQGVWLKLENAIRSIEDKQGHDHMWVIVGPIFGEQPVSINRGAGKFLHVPDAYFCITIDPWRYPYDTLGSANIDGFIMPQDAPRSSDPQDYPATVGEIEAATGLQFFGGWGQDVPEAIEQQMIAPPVSRMAEALSDFGGIWQEEREATAQMQPSAASIGGLIDQLREEAETLQSLERALTDSESARLTTLQHTISWLHAASKIACEVEEAEPEDPPANLITYHVEDDMDERLKHAARTACNFWNRFIEPEKNIVMQLGLFTSSRNTIAKAWKPFEKGDVRYGRVKFNTKYLVRFTPDQVAGTIIHELGHTLGIGWDEWRDLFNPHTGIFTDAAVRMLRSLEHMEVERDGGSGTALSHWDEGKFDKELMTGYKDGNEFVMPVTIDVLALFRHNVVETLEEATPMDELLIEATNVVFSKQDQVREIDLTHFEETELMETIPHDQEQDTGSPPAE